MSQQQQEAHTSLRVFIYRMDITILGLPTLSGFGGDEISFFFLILSPNVTPGQALHTLCMPLSDLLADFWHTSIPPFGSLLYQLREIASLPLGMFEG